MKGKNISGFIIEQEIGQGGYATVYKARNAIKKNEAVAVKILKDKSRFSQECLSANLKPHPNVIEFKIGDIEHEPPYLVMEYASGGNLRKLIGTLKSNEAIGWTEGILAGLDYLHENGIVHGDLKPENVLLEDRVAKLSDFGLSINFTEEDILSFSKSQEVSGTLDYLAPEIRQKQKPDARSDIFSFGVMFYEMLTGEKPVGAYESTGDEKLDQIILKCLQRKPEKRYQTTREVIIDLRKIKDAPEVKEETAETNKVKYSALERKTSEHQPVFVEPKLKKSYFWTKLGGLAAVLGLGALIGTYSLFDSEGNFKFKRIEGESEQTSEEEVEQVPLIENSEPDQTTEKDETKNDEKIKTVYELIPAPEKPKTENLPPPEPPKPVVPKIEKPKEKNLRQFVFVSNREGKEKIYLADEEHVKSPIRIITYGYSPSFSPEGKKMTFTKSAVDEYRGGTMPKVYCMHTAGYGEEEIYQWSADSPFFRDENSLFFRYKYFEEWSIYLADLNKKGEEKTKRITSGSKRFSSVDANKDYLVYVPDDSRIHCLYDSLEKTMETEEDIAYSYAAIHPNKPIIAAAPRSVYNKKSKRSEERSGMTLFEIVEGATPKLSAVQDDLARGLRITYLKWSEDGSKIAIMGIENNQLGLYVFDQESSTMNYIQAIKDCSGCYPVCSSEGKILFSEKFNAFKDPATKNSEIFIVDVKGKGLKNLTDDIFEDTCPVWIPLPK